MSTRRRVAGPAAAQRYLARALLLLIFAAAPAVALAEGLHLASSRAAIAPGGDPVVFSLRLPRAGVASLVLYDLQHRRVRTLLDATWLDAGLHTASWNGETDGGGIAGTGQAYYPVASLSTPGQPDLVWDTAAATLGKPVDISPIDCRFDSGAKRVRFSLPAPARVRLRAGIHHGPLLKNLLEWAPRQAGDHSVAWDGKDELGRIDVAGHRDFSLAAQAYSLPDGAVILEGPASESTGLASAGSNAKDQLRTQLLRKSSAAAGQARDSHALFAKAVEEPPAFRIEFVEPLGFESGTPVVGRRCAVRVVLDPGSASQMLSDRFEIIVYADLQRVFEEEQAYTPYTVEFDTGALSPGDHLLSVSVASLSDRLATQSAPFRVR